VNRESEIVNWVSSPKFKNRKAKTRTSGSPIYDSRFTIYDSKFKKP